MDAWLLRKFPGRTLEELDGMDWGRFNRAMEAGRIEYIEDRRALGVEEPAKLSAEEWAEIAELDELWEQIADG